jgi:uncharacterized repeat protein (TIGR01451 family)
MNMHLRIRTRKSLSRVAGTAGLSVLMLASSCASTPKLGWRRNSSEADSVAKSTEHLPGRPDITTAKDAPPSYAEKLERAKQAQTSKSPAVDREIQHAVVEPGDLNETIQPLGFAEAASTAERPAEFPTAEADPDPEPPAPVERPWAPDIESPVIAPINDAAIADAVCPVYPRVILPPAECKAGCQLPPCEMEDGSDEYVCDGGDAGYPVHYEADQIAGLEVQDTVAEFIDSRGERQVKASNQVCVYSPRFGVARAVSDAVEDYHVDRATGTHDGVKIAGYAHRSVIGEKIKTDVLSRLQSRDRLGGVEGTLSDGAIDHDTVPALHAKLVNAFEEYAFAQRGQFDVSDREGLMQLVQAAISWQDQVAPRIVAEALGGQQVESTAIAAEYVGVEDPRKDGELRLIKIADKTSAKLGETVTFTLRFDNLGGRDLSQVRVIDHLSPRLELIEDSIACDLPAAHDITVSEEGGAVLEVRLDEPLAGETGGAIRFECRVR